MIELSICICTMNKRAGMLARLLRDLESQIVLADAKDRVEILVEIDDGEMPTGRKRNILYNRAVGKYVVSVDDDDTVPHYYVAKILEAIQSDPDAIAMNGVMTTNGRLETKWFIAKDNPYCASRDKRGKTIYLRYQNHIAPIRRSIAIQFPFPEISMHEDYSFAVAINKAQAIKTEATIGTAIREFMQRYSCTADFPMYFYRFVTNK
jgi:glycosyltransferase involved in cell wall biosynthesis